MQPRPLSHTSEMPNDTAAMHARIIVRVVEAAQIPSLQLFSCQYFQKIKDANFLLRPIQVPV